jgi:hypothetical protein
MDNDANGLTELDEDILTFDVSDDALERTAATSDGQAVTIGYCTPLVSLQLAHVMAKWASRAMCESALRIWSGPNRRGWGQ